MWIICTALLCSVVFCTATRQEYGLCSQVYLMSQYCSNNDVTPTGDVTVLRGAIGKAGPAGVKGEKGDQGIANFTSIENEMKAKIIEVEKKFESKFKEYKIVMNKVVTNLEKKVAELDSKFVEYEAAMNKTASRLEKELEVSTTTGCHAVKAKNVKQKSGTGGVFDINLHNSPTEVFCDLTTDGGKWTVFQRRVDGSQDFSKDWSSYVAGFGDLTGEFWLGLEKLHLLSRDGEYELRVELTDKNDKIGIATYQTFLISGNSENYKLNVGGFSGTGLSDWLAWHNNMAFSTKDRDNDKWGKNCAVSLGGGGGWWFNACRYSMLNHAYGSIIWNGFENIKKTEMKFRKK